MKGSMKVLPGSDLRENVAESSRARDDFPRRKNLEQ